jgi:hypothetical protein
VTPFIAKPELRPAADTEGICYFLFTIYCWKLTRDFLRESHNGDRFQRRGGREMYIGVGTVVLILVILLLLILLF